MSDVEFDAWETPFKDGELTILDVRYDNGELDNEYPAEKIGFRLPKKYDLDDSILVVRLFFREEKSVYSLYFENVGAFRVLDEDGLCEIWQATAQQGGRPAHSTFKVRNHLWSKESPLSFFSSAADDWSYLIATDWACVEVICKEPPEIQFEENVSGYRLEE